MALIETNLYPENLCGSDVGLLPVEQNEEPNTAATKSMSGCEKYSLRPRSIQKRIETESRQVSSRVKKPPKPKQRPPPLSKYRRRTANARERYRMQEINEAFETLRKVVPHMSVQSPSDKTTKITTLRLAVNYIQALANLLQQCDTDGNQRTDTGFTYHDRENAVSSAATVPLPTSDLNVVSHKTPLSSLGSSSDFSDFLSDDDSPFIDNFDVFGDLPSIAVSDTLDILLDSDGESLNFNSDLSDQATP